MKDLYYVKTYAREVNLLGTHYDYVIIDWFCMHRDNNPLAGSEITVYESTDAVQLKPAGTAWNQLFSEEEAKLLCQHLSFSGWASQIQPYYSLRLPQDKRGFAWAAGDTGCYVQLFHEDPQLPDGIQGHIKTGACYMILGQRDDSPQFANVNKEAYDELMFDGWTSEDIEAVSISHFEPSEDGTTDCIGPNPQQRGNSPEGGKRSETYG